jgi:hypothetical protein
VDLGTLDGVGGQHHAPTGKDPVPIVQEAGWASQPVWRGAENFAPTGIRSPDLPAPSELLYQLSCTGSFGVIAAMKMINFYSINHFKLVGKISKSDYLLRLSVRPSVCPTTTRLPLNGFL